MSFKRMHALLFQFYPWFPEPEAKGKTKNENTRISLVGIAYTFMELEVHVFFN